VLGNAQLRIAALYFQRCRSLTCVAKLNNNNAQQPIDRRRCIFQHCL
jgi:hypothetical protein